MTLFVRELSISYGKAEILANISFSFAAGCCAALIGPNGTGKSSLLRAIAGLQTYGGTVSLLSGEQPEDAIAYMPQDTGAASALTVMEVVLLGRLRSLGLRVSGRDRTAALEALAVFGLTDLQSRTLGHLSGGQRQLVFVAQALVRAPAVLLLDEPTAALDLRHQILVLDIVRKHCREHGILAIAAMHDLSLATRFADQVICLSDGRILATGAPETVLTTRTIEQLYGVTAEITRTASGALAITPTGLVNAHPMAGTRFDLNSDAA